jgi:digalactosyldiacylglycerol synthase
LMEAVLPECQTLDRLCHANHSSSTVDDPPAVPHNTSPEDTSPIALHTDLSDPSLRIWVVTTAALPWRTGTSVNPLARALYLTDHRPAGHVTLVVPFVTNPQEQAKIYPKGVFFETPTQQEQWIRTYCAERVHCPGN